MVHVDPDKSTNGQRFWLALAHELNGRGVSMKRPTMLFNASARVSDLLLARLLGKRVVLRIDGIYCDRLSPAFIGTFRVPLVRALLRFAAARQQLRERAAFLANLVDRNYGVYARLALASDVIYQSAFGRACHERFMPRRGAAVILNGAAWRGAARRPADGVIRVALVYDPWRPSKRIGDAVRFIRWARDERAAPLQLILFGYDASRQPLDFGAAERACVETAPWVTTTPRFAELDYDLASSCHAYLTLSYRDTCPNALIEVMACGVPAVGLASGGVPEIVGDAGILLPADDFERGFYTAHRFENEFPPIDREALLRALVAVASGWREYRARVAKRFARDLDLKVVADRYTARIGSL